MASAAIPKVPRDKPKTLGRFLVLAAQAFFPINNERRLQRILALLIERHAAGKWLSRIELWSFWGVRPTSLREPEDRRRLGNSITNGLSELRRHLAQLAWTVPNFHIELVEEVERSGARYRLKIARRCEPWDFNDKEAPHAEASDFCYRFTGAPDVRSIPAQVWRAPKLDQQLRIVAERISATATWRPPSHGAAYEKLRDACFEAAKQRAAKFGRKLHPGDLWGIRDVQDEHVDGASTVRLTTTRITYADNLYVRSCLHSEFPPLKKSRTVKDWLGIDPSWDGNFCPPRDALCVSVALVTKRGGLTVYMSKQRTDDASLKWELTAQGAASSSNLLTKEESPDISEQVRTVVLRETGVRFEAGQITWLGFARSKKNGDSSVIALVELDSTPGEMDPDR